MFTIQEFPLIRYRAAKFLDVTTITTFSDLIPTKLAAGVWNCLQNYKETLRGFPQKETCELLILDRTVDQVLSCKWCIVYNISNASCPYYLYD